MKKLSIFLLTFFICFSALAQTVFNFSAEKDNTMYSEDVNLSLGAGVHLFAGKNNNADVRRALIKFDISSIPSTATVTDVTLELTLNKTTSGAKNVSVYSLTKDWGEGTSNNAGFPGKGGPATTADCTYSYTFWSVSMWTSNGGDFDVPSLASTSVDGNATYQWNNFFLLNKVRGWVDGTSTNNGFILLGDETTSPTSKRFNSRESSTDPPKLIVTIMGPTGLSNSVRNPRFSIIPNPVSDSFRINGNKEINKLEIFDLKGSKIKTLSPALKEHNIKGLNRGIYLIKIQGAGFSITQKLIKK